MKKTILILGVLTLFSCSKNSDKIDVVKEKIKSYATSNDPDEYDYDVYESDAHEVYGTIQKEYSERIERMEEMGNHVAAGDLLKEKGNVMAEHSKNKDKKFYTVHVYKVTANDTVKNMLYFVSEENEIIGNKSK